MKGLVLLILTQICIFGSTSAGIINLAKIPIPTVKEFEREAAARISNMLLQRLRQNSEDHLPAPELSKLPDELPVEGEYDFSELGTNHLISGNVSMGGGVITGLSSLYPMWGFHSHHPDYRSTFDLSARDWIKMSGDYTADILLNDVIPISGDGTLEANIEGLFFKIIVNVEVSEDGRINVTNVAIDVGLQNLFIVAENFKVCDEEIDWAKFNFKPTFDAVWAEQKPGVQNLVQRFLNELFKDCVLIDGESSCPHTVTEVPNAAGNAVTLEQTITFFKYAVKAFVPIISSLECNDIFPPSTTGPSITTRATTMSPTTQESFALGSRLIAIKLLLLTTFFTTIYSIQL